MYEIDGFGFIKLRDIVEKFGILKMDIRILKVVLVYVFIIIFNSEGNFYLFEEELMSRVFRVIDVDVDFKLVIDEFIKENKLVLEDDKYFLK